MASGFYVLFIPPTTLLLKDSWSIHLTEQTVHRVTTESGHDRKFLLTSGPRIFLPTHITSLLLTSS